MEKISEQVEQILQREDDFCRDVSELKKYSDALDSYKKMIADGLIKPRGNRLIDIEKRMRVDIIYNCPSGGIENLMCSPFS